MFLSHSCVPWTTSTSFPLTHVGGPGRQASAPLCWSLRKTGGTGLPLCGSFQRKISFLRELCKSCILSCGPPFGVLFWQTHVFPIKKPPRRTLCEYLSRLPVRVVYDELGEMFQLDKGTPGPRQRGPGIVRFFLRNTTKAQQESLAASRQHGCGPHHRGPVCLHVLLSVFASSPRSSPLSRRRCVLWARGRRLLSFALTSGWLHSQKILASKGLCEVESNASPSHHSLVPFWKELLSGHVESGAS